VFNPESPGDPQDSVAGSALTRPSQTPSMASAGTVQKLAS
jgi:hypothetical protein